MRLMIDDVFPLILCYGINVAIIVLGLLFETT